MNPLQMTITQATYLCDDEEGNTITSTVESEEVTLMVDRGFVSNPLCQIFGDPHVITFDQKIYSFQVCSFSLLLNYIVCWVSILPK